MELVIYTDGGSLNNPGPAASAFAIYQNSTLLFSHGETIGINTNNVAEYTALIIAFKKVKELLRLPQYSSISTIQVFSDSQLMVRQLSGLYKIKDPKIALLATEAKKLQTELNLPVSYTSIPREKNTYTDSLVKKALGR